VRLGPRTCVRVSAQADRLTRPTRPEDEDSLKDEPKAALAIATELKQIGTDAFKTGDFATALDKYQKAVRYLDQHPYPDDEDVAAFKALRFPLLNNAALCALKLTPKPNA
jgi:peptidyl-prolyl isomerase D